MDIQNSDALHRRHENEWAAFRNAVQQKESTQKSDEPTSDQNLSESKPSGRD